MELIILAVLAAVVLYQLYAVLGRRVGRQPEDAAKAKVSTPREPARESVRRMDEPPPATQHEGLTALRARDRGFDPEHFLQGARAAYELIVRSFAAGDRVALGHLVAPEVMRGFDRAIAAREGEARTESVEFRHAPRADIEQTEITGDMARIRVRFLAEFRSRSKGNDGEAVDDRRTAELWTFERDLSSQDPNWTLARVDAAEA